MPPTGMRRPCRSARSSLRGSRFIRRGAPDTTQILFKTSVRPAPVTIVPMVGKAPALPLNDTKTTLRYRIDWAIDIHAVTFDATPDHLRHGLIRLDVVAHDVGGATEADDSNQFVLTFTPAQYEKFLTVGFQHSQTLELPSGITSLHLGVLDTASRNTGSTEILLQVGSLGKR